MCGLLGLLNSPPDPELRTERLHHRGPDAQGSWIAPPGEQPATLSHTRLSIIDLGDAATQPMHSPCGRYVFVYNGEIYNFLELRADLERSGERFHTESDTEVMLRGLMRDGPAFQLRCNGMWAYCLWDRRTGTALLGRDRFGKKPMFWTRTAAGGIAFASEMKALYPLLPRVEPAPDILRLIADPFCYEHSESCAVGGINRLRPGHVLHVDQERVRSERWWNTLDHLADVPRRYDEQVERWREIFLDAVKLRMRSDVPIGTALSGGFDSSATLCAMSHVAGMPGVHMREAPDWRHAFCAHFPGSSLDERSWARRVTDHLGIGLNVIQVDPLTPEWSIRRALFQVEDPYLTLPVPMLATYAAIRAAGVRVTLDGHGADELFCGYGHQGAALLDANGAERGEIVSIGESLRTGVLARTSKGMETLACVREFIRYRILARLPAARQLKITRPALPLDHPDCTHPAYAAMDNLSRVLYRMFHITALPTLLRNYDRYSMASGVEIRMPFMDWRLVCYTFSLPWQSKLGGGYTKRIARDAMRGIVPDVVLERRDKIGWNAPLHEWLRGPLRSQVDELLADASTLTPIPPRVARAWTTFQNNPAPSYSDGERIWQMLLPWIWRVSFAGD